MFAVMKLLREYISLEDTLIHLKHQVRDSIPYAEKIIPDFDTPEELFYYLRDRVQYINDPEDVELMMTLNTFVSGSRTGIPWGGDCDDFTIVSLAALAVNGFTPSYVVLVGRSQNVPVHIYAGVVDGKEVVPFDLTNKHYGHERSYKYQQVLPFAL